MTNDKVTYTKAIGIILMVLCHCSNFEFLYRFVYMFHMPLFFVMAGYCFKKEYLHKPFIFLKKRIKGIYWPYIKYSILFLLLHNIFFKYNILNDKYGYRGVTSHLLTTNETLESIKSIVFTMHGNGLLLGGYWFLNALFWGSIIAFSFLSLSHHLFREKSESPMANIILLVVMSILCIYVNCPYKTFTILLIGPQAFLAALFYLAGHTIRVVKMRTLHPIEILLSVIIIYVGAYKWQMSAGDTFYDIRILFPYIITAILGSWCIYSMPWHKMSYNASIVLKYIGNHTLNILTWHFLSFKIVSLFIITIYNLPIEHLAEFPAIARDINNGWFILYSFVGIFVPLLLSYLWESSVQMIKIKVLTSHS